MPAEVHQHINDCVNDLDFEGVAKACDKQTGKLKDSKHSTAISSIRTSRPQQQQQPRTTFTAPFPSDDDETNVNAVRFRSGQRQNFKISNRSSSRVGSSSNSNSTRFNMSANQGEGVSSSNCNPPLSNNKVCRFHIRFGEELWPCEGSWCILKSKVTPKGQANH